MDCIILAGHLSKGVQSLGAGTNITITGTTTNPVVNSTRFARAILSSATLVGASVSMPLIVNVGEATLTGQPELIPAGGRANSGLIFEMPCDGGSSYSVVAIIGATNLSGTEILAYETALTVVNACDTFIPSAADFTNLVTQTGSDLTLVQDSVLNRAVLISAAGGMYVPFMSL